MRGNVSVAFTLTFLLSGWPLLAASQIKAAPPVVSLPRGEVSRIPSPNGKWALIFQCPIDCSERKLWVEETSSHARKLVKEYDRSLDISWAPDSRLFFVNDNSGSTDARCYVYEAASLKETDVAEVVLARYPDAEQFLDSGHSYLRAKRWLNSHALVVVLTGHNDGSPPGAFTLRYRVDLNGSVHRLSQHSEEQRRPRLFSRCVYPTGLREEMARKYPGTRPIRWEDLDEYDRQYFQKGMGTRCPGLLKVNFYGDGKPTWAVGLVKGAGSNRRVELVVARQLGKEWEMRSLLALDGADSPVIMSQGPGEYREDPGGTTIQAKNPVIIFINWGSWAFTWIDGQVKKIMP